VPCSRMTVFKRRDRLRDLLLAMMITLLAPPDLAILDQTHTEVVTLALIHMEVETLALIHMEAEILVQADMEEIVEATTTTTTTRCVVLL